MEDLTISMMALTAKIESENREVGVQGHTKAREKGWTVTKELAYSLSNLQLNSGEMKLVVLNGREYLGREGEWWTEGLLMSTLSRPMAEPPIFDYEWMIEEKGWLEETAKSHDMKYDRDVKFKTERIDRLIERRLLAEYKDWAEQDLQALDEHPIYRSVSESTKEERTKFTARLMASIALDKAEVDLNLWDLESTKKTSKRWDTLGIPTLEKPTEQVWRQQRPSILQSRSEKLKLLEKPVHY